MPPKACLEGGRAAQGGAPRLASRSPAHGGGISVAAAGQEGERPTTAARDAPSQPAPRGKSQSPPAELGPGAFLPRPSPRLGRGFPSASRAQAAGRVRPPGAARAATARPPAGKKQLRASAFGRPRLPSPGGGRHASGRPAAASATWVARGAMATAPPRVLLGLRDAAVPPGEALPPQSTASKLGGSPVGRGPAERRRRRRLLLLPAAWVGQSEGARAVMGSLGRAGLGARLNPRQDLRRAASPSPLRPSRRRLPAGGAAVQPRSCPAVLAAAEQDGVPVPALSRSAADRRPRAGRQARRSPRG